MTIQEWLHKFPLIAILRGIETRDVVKVGGVLHAAGFRIIEVPLNSPLPLESIRALSESLPDCLIGAGTVTTQSDVTAVRDAGGKLIVMPHSDPAIIRRAKECGMICLPGVATPTEAFAALAAGADGLKMFPADQLGIPTMKAWRSVLPKNTLLIPVGGVDQHNLTAYLQAGADGIGLGSSLYKPAMAAADVAAIANHFGALVAQRNHV